MKPIQVPGKQHHELKTWQPFFDAISEGRKTFEARKNDRDFREGDTVCLREYDPYSESYTGEVINAKVGFVLNGIGFGVEPGFCVFSIILQS